jgi:DNA-binding CsgD family transcriptional regulator
MSHSTTRTLLKLITHDLSAIGRSVDETIGRNATNQHTRSSLRDIREAIDLLHAKINDLGKSASILTKREEEILIALGSGKTALAIARLLQISEPTVKSHVMSIYRKLDVNNKTSALAEAARRGLLPK